MPASRFLLGLVLAAYAAIAIATFAVVPVTQVQMLRIVVETVVDLGAVYLLLRVLDRPRRFLQTVTAMFGAGVVLNVLALPVLYWDEMLGGSSDGITPPGFILLMMFFWGLDIAGFILSRAAAWPYIVGLSVVVVYELTSLTVLEAILPAAG